MSDLLPLLMLWGLSRKSSTTDPPPWPSVHAPPPPHGGPMPMQPMDASPAAVVVPTDVHFHPAESGTPLASLLKDQAATIAKRKAATAAKGVAKGAAKKLKGFLHAPAVGPPAPAQTNVAVADLQSALIKRGAKLTRDGLYGPKTAAAWKSLANQKRLSPMISRVGPKIARVATNTYTLLSVPAIP